jgi:hypothetical protein
MKLLSRDEHNLHVVDVLLFAVVRWRLGDLLRLTCNYSVIYVASRPYAPPPPRIRTFQCQVHTTWWQK